MCLGFYFYLFLTVFWVLSECPGLLSQHGHGSLAHLEGTRLGKDNLAGPNKQANKPSTVLLTAINFH